MSTCFLNTFRDGNSNTALGSLEWKILGQVGWGLRVVLAPSPLPSLLQVSHVEVWPDFVHVPGGLGACPEQAPQLLQGWGPSPVRAARPPSRDTPYRGAQEVLAAWVVPGHPGRQGQMFTTS